MKVLIKVNNYICYQENKILILNDNFKITIIIVIRRARSSRFPYRVFLNKSIEKEQTLNSKFCVPTIALNVTQ